MIKIRLQLQSHSLSDPLDRPIRPTYKGILPTLKTILREEGVTGLWKGNIPAEALYVTYGAAQFSTYKFTTSILQELPKPVRPSDGAISFVSGATAGTIATTATYPLDLLRTRFAAQGNDKVYSSLLASIHNIYAHEGTAGFFRGLSAAIVQIVPYMGLFFASYESFKPAFSLADLPFGSSDAIAGVTASVLSKTAVFPLDTVRKRLQVQGPTRARYVHRNIPEYAGGVTATIKAILKAEGVRGMYRGLTVSLLKAAPASAVTMWTYERTMDVLVRMEKRFEEN